MGSQALRLESHIQYLTDCIFHDACSDTSHRDVSIHCADGKKISANKQLLSLGSKLLSSVLGIGCPCLTYLQIQFHILLPDFRGDIVDKVLLALQTGHVQLDQLDLGDVQEINSLLDTLKIVAVELALVNTTVTEAEDIAEENITEENIAEDDIAEENIAEDDIVENDIDSALDVKIEQPSPEHLVQIFDDFHVIQVETLPMGDPGMSQLASSPQDSKENLRDQISYLVEVPLEDGDEQNHLVCERFASSPIHLQIADYKSQNIPSKKRNCQQEQEAENETEIQSSMNNGIVDSIQGASLQHESLEDQEVNRLFYGTDNTSTVIISQQSVEEQELEANLLFYGTNNVSTTIVEQDSVEDQELEANHIFYGTNNNSTVPPNRKRKLLQVQLKTCNARKNIRNHKIKLQQGLKLAKRKKPSKATSTTIAKSKDSYECSLCRCKFGEVEQLQKHMVNSHQQKLDRHQKPLKNTATTSAKPFVCNFCKSKFEEVAQLQNHNLEEHGNTSYWMCELCNKAFHLKSGIKLHNLNHHEDGGLFHFKNFKDSNLHHEKNQTNRHSNATDDNQSDCLVDAPVSHSTDQNQRSKKNWRVGSDSINHKTFFKCNFCDREFGSNDYLSVHVRRLHPEHHQEASGFDVEFLSDSHDEREEGQHHQKVAQVEESMTSKEDPEHRSHKRVKQNIVEPHLNCHVCDKAFKKQRQVTNHIMKHHNNETVEDSWSEEDKEISGHHNGDTVLLIDTDVNNDSSTSSEVHYISNKEEFHSSSGRKRLKLKNPFSCDHCTKTFVQEETLLKHLLLEHTGEDELRCRLCPQVFYQKTLLKAHIMNDHRPFKCNHCDESFSKKWSRASHVRMMHNGKKTREEPHPSLRIEQENHNGQFSNVDDELKCHNNEQPSSEDDELCCQFCDNLFDSKVALKMHILEAHEDKRTFKCDFCDSAFFLESSLEDHVSVDHMNSLEDNNQSNENQMEETEEDLGSSNKLKPPGKTYECLICCEHFQMRKILSEHYLTVHNAGQVDLPCRFCQKTFSRVERLAIHIMNVHQGRRRFQCQACEKSFHQKIYLQRHFACVHQKKKPYKCKVCRFSFGLPENLKRHMQRMHSRY